MNRQIIRNDIEDYNTIENYNTINQLYLIDIDRTLHPTAAENTLKAS